MFNFVKQCRSCGNLVANLVPVFDLGLQPLANDFKKQDEEQSGYAPLKVLFCEQCSLAQLSVVVKPELLYSQYAYTTSRSKTMLAHFELLWQAINIECNPESVVEIGSNDGFFLEFCKANGADHVCGIDPANNLTPAIIGCFDAETARLAKCVVPLPSVVVARHVFAHVDDWGAFMRDLDSLCCKDTLVVIEAPYAVDTLERGEFDQIYHEHLSYLSLKAMAALLESTPFRIQSVKRFPVHGGVIAIFIRRRDFEDDPSPAVGELMAAENITANDWKRLASRAHREIDTLRSRVNALSGSLVIAGYGASAKSTVWINASCFSKRQVRFVTDTTPWKVGRLIPGTDIPVLAESAIKSERPDCMICFAWNYKAEILDKEQEYLSNGGQFIFPHDL